MSTPSAAAQAPIPPEVRQQAAAWLVELQSDDASEQTWQRWRAWRAAHPDHERAWQRVEALGSKLQSLQPALAHAALAPTGSPNRRRVIQGLVVVLFAGSVAWVAQDRTHWRQWVADRRTGVGERATVTLPDGTRVDLNSDSAIDIAFTDAERVLRLLGGEILVATAPDSQVPARPFIVRTAQGRLQPLGTRFSVRQIARGQSHVAVYEGAVSVQPSQGNARVLSAGEQAGFTRVRVSASAAADETGTAWVRGTIVAQDMPLGDFIAELARYRSGWLDCAPAVAGLKVTGTYPVDDTTRVLAMLARTLPVEIHYRTRYWASVRPRKDG